MDTRRGLTGPIETPDDPRQRSLTVQPEESNSTANREAAATAATSFGSSEEQKLLERADTLLKLGDISGARLVLERALGTGSAIAAFKLAETYDPRQLTRWRAHGMRGDWVRAQALYERARSGGVVEAEERLGPRR